MAKSATKQPERIPSTGESVQSSEREPGTSDAAGQGAKRSARACDKCRRSKIKCEPAPGEQTEICKSCLAAATECTFSDPTFRRGPPKGYIKALEHRLHQMESMLAAIMSCEDGRATSIISDLRKDQLANDILKRVDSGPFGPTGRLRRSVDPTEDNFFASIMGDEAQANPPKPVNERARRQSRVSRESVIQTDPLKLTRPNLEWQDRLSKLLASSRANTRETSTVPSSKTIRQPSEAASSDGEPPRQRRRTSGSPSRLDLVASEENGEGSQGTQEEELNDCSDAFGNLSMDENREVRYHGNSCGLQLLAQQERYDNRITGGIWNFPMAKLWPGLPSTSTQEHVVDFQLPTIHIQDHLIHLYFTYVNPVVPVIDKESFLADLSLRRTGETIQEEQTGSVKPEHTQKITDLLLFSMFAFAAHYSEDVDSITRAAASGARYAAQARKALDTMYQESRTSTCQALILLGVRGFGVGSVEEGWIHIGMAIRMAFDLGLNRNADRWQIDGRDLFSSSQKELRNRIWWACCLGDRYSSIFLGRPMTIREGDYATPLPHPPESDAEEIWHHYGANLLSPGEISILARPILCFKEASSLSIIFGEIITKIYPVTHVSSTSRRVLMEKIHLRLLQWYLALPDSLKYSTTSTGPCPAPAPHVLFLHVQYWAAVLLLHRLFIPRMSDISPDPASRIQGQGVDYTSWRSLDMCQSAASHICKIAMNYHEAYGLRWSHPILMNYLQSAGIMHIAILISRPLDAQATIGLQNCFDALDQIPWPTAARVCDILKGVKFQLDERLRLRAPAGEVNRRKRPAEDVNDTDAPYSGVPLGPDQEISSYAAPLEVGELQPEPLLVGSEIGLQGFTSSDVFNAATFTGYDFWPEFDSLEPPSLLPQPALHPTNDTVPAHSFTFNDAEYSENFLQALRDPVLHFPFSSSRT
ncbi:hypothetical protein OBBRIDRAFT_794671 [Obba rivulosa]|uniref:Zn(2)-C6 fungal-type domain-containing protein n=1 Tax=Obba rivulosa TaxID=1052685 RepID=A0A8E2DI70_9APHY|nr:hypothetical protein OBBRIDRAFT_794671 [Obba rivulosa]